MSGTCVRVMLALSGAAAIAVSTASALGPEDEKQTGIITIEQVDGQSVRRLFSHTKLIKAMSDNLGDAKQVNIFGLWCSTGGLIEAVKANEPSFKYAIGAAAAFDKTTSALMTTKEGGNGRLKIGNIYRAGFTAYTTKGLVDAGATVPTFNGLFNLAATNYDEDPAFAKAENLLQHPKRVSMGASGDLRLDQAEKGNHLITFVGDTRGDYEDPQMYRLLHKTAKELLKPKTAKLYLEREPASMTVDGYGSKVNFVASMQALKPLLTADAGKQIVNLFLAGHGFYQTVSKDLEATAIPGTPGSGRRFNPGAATIDITMGETEWEYLKAPSAVSSDERRVRAMPPEIFLTMSEGVIDEPMGVWINDLYLGHHEVDIGSRGGELRIPLTDPQISDLIAMHDMEESLDIRVELGANSWFTLGSDGDLLGTDVYDVGYAGAGMSFVISQVPGPSTTAALVLAGVIGRRRRR